MTEIPSLQQHRESMTKKPNIWANMTKNQNANKYRNHKELISMVSPPWKLKWEFFSISYEALP